MWTNSSHPKSSQRTCIAWTQTTIFTIRTFGGRVQENSSTRTFSAACVLCCTTTFLSSPIGTWMTGGVGRARVREDRGGKRSRTCRRHRQAREMGVALWELLLDEATSVLQMLNPIIWDLRQARWEPFWILGFAYIPGVPWEGVN